MDLITIMDMVNGCMVRRSARKVMISGEEVIALSITLDNGQETQMVMPLNTADDIMRTISEALASEPPSA